MCGVFWGLGIFSIFSIFGIFCPLALGSAGRHREDGAARGIFCCAVGGGICGLGFLVCHGSVLGLLSGFVMAAGNLRADVCNPAGRKLVITNQKEYITFPAILSTRFRQRTGHSFFLFPFPKKTVENTHIRVIIS